MKTVKEMVDELIQSGLSQPRIAELSETSQATISRIIHNKQKPSFDIGRRIESVYSDRIGSG